MKKIKVATVITKLELGGAQLVALHGASGLDPDQFESHFITNTEGLLVEDAKSRLTLQCHFISALRREIRPWWDLLALYKLWHFFRRYHIDIVHTHSSKAGILGRIAARLAGVPVIIHTIHGFSFHDFQHPAVRQFYILLEYFCNKLSTKLIAVARANIEKGLSAGLGPREKYVVIRAGIELDEFANTRVDAVPKKKELSLPSDALVVAQVGNFKPQKNPLEFVRVAAKVSQLVPQAHFLLVGDGPLRPEVEALVQELGLDDRVHLLGWRHDVPEIMQIVDVMALTSRWEGLPCVYPQAMAAGKPIVGTAVDGGPEAVHFGVNGFLFPPGAVDDMAEKIILLLQDEELRHKMGQAGREIVAEFDIEHLVPQLESLYLNLATTQ